MKTVKLTSSCGKACIVCHPSKVEEMKKAGWVEDKPIKINRPAKADTIEKEVK